MEKSIQIEPNDLAFILAQLGLPAAEALEPLEGGSGRVFRVALCDRTSVVLKTYDGKPGASDAEVFAADLLASSEVPATRYLHIDDSCTRLPFPFALTSYLPGRAAISFASHPGYIDVFRQIGSLARKLHSITMPGFGSLQAPSYPDNAGFLRALANNAFERFLYYGADPSLTESLSAIFERDFHAIVPTGNHAVLAHDDLHPNNVLVTELDTGLHISGLIDFGNARAQTAVMDLAKTMLICEHMAPGSSPAILAGYGPIDHPRPQEALAYYTMLHRVIMWWWLRHIGILASPDTESDLMESLKETVHRGRLAAT